jgi:peptidoglycan hydrolase-like protein with peptidoglycan-binding domain
VWSKTEWEEQTAQYRLPVYVRSDPPAIGAAADAADAIAQLKVIGAPKGTLVAWDMETAVDVAYVAAVNTALKAAGYSVVLYGSWSGVLANRHPQGWYWGAVWNGNATVEPEMVMHQYESTELYDLSVADDNLPFWNTKPVDPPPPPPPPPGVSYITASDVENILGKLPNLAQGNTDSQFPHHYVERAQALLNLIYGGHLTVDGNYGPATKAAVESAQRQGGLSVDGVVGSNTWDLLVTGS